MDEQRFSQKDSWWIFSLLEKVAGKATKQKKLYQKGSALENRLLIVFILEKL